MYGFDALLEKWKGPLLAFWAARGEQILRGVRWGLTAIAPVALFLMFFNPGVLDPTRIGWLLENDWGQHVLGWHAYRMDDWSWAFYHQDLLAYPTGLNVIYTDSNPWWSLPLKVLSPILPERFQFIGPWFFFCVVAHFYFAYKLLRPHAPNAWIALLGAIALSLLPTLYYRMRHDTLMAQWLILWGLHIFINIDDEKKKTIGYACLLGLTGLIHPYLLVMVAAIWGGDVLRRFWPAAWQRNWKELGYTTLSAVIVLAVPLFTMALGGTYGAGQSPGAGGFGFYSMGLDALINPEDEKFSLFMRAWPQDAGQHFEGYQYLGFGILLLIAFAAVLYAIVPESRQAKSVIGKFKPMILPFIALFLLSISNVVQIYDIELFRIEMPEPIKDILAVLRASGRFFWPIAYAMVAIALIVVFKSRLKIAAIALPALLAVQIIDLQGFALEMRKATHFATYPYSYFVARAPEWDTLIAGSKRVDFYPTDPHYTVKKRLFYEVAWRAVSEKIPVNAMYPARYNVAQMNIEAEGERQFRNGAIDDDNLYVFLTQCAAPAELRPYMREVDGVWVIPPKHLRNLPLAEPTWKPVPSMVRFGFYEQGTCWLDNNWKRPSSGGTWTAGELASLTVPIGHMDHDIEQPEKARLRIRALSREPVWVTVLVNGVEAGEFALDRVVRNHDVPLSKRAMKGEELTVTFAVRADRSVLMMPVVSYGDAPSSGRSHGKPAEAVKSVPDPASFKLIRIEVVDKDASVEAET